MSEQLFHVGVKALIVNDNDEFLLLKVHKDRFKTSENLWSWDLPGGRIQAGDSAEQTLAKELSEEIGYTGSLEPNLVSSCIANKMIPAENGQLGLVLFVYEIKIDQNFEIELSEEHETYEWCISNEAKTRLSQKYPESLLGSL